MRIKVHGGTPNSESEQLCVTCRYASLMAGTNREAANYCRFIDKFLTFQVTACTQYDDKRLPSVSDLEKIAWKLCADKKGRTVGFLSPGDYVDKRQAGVIRKFDPDDYESFAGE